MECICRDYLLRTRVEDQPKIVKDIQENEQRYGYKDAKANAYMYKTESETQICGANNLTDVL